MMPEAKCPICGKDLKVGPGEEYVGLVVGPVLELWALGDDQVAYAHPPCGWVILRKKLVVL